MIDLQGIIETDRLATLAMNGSDSLFMDGVAFMFSGKLIWIPLILSLFYLVMKNNQPKSFFIIVGMMILTIAMADQVSSSVIKPLVMRLRPSQDPIMLNMVDTVKGYRGGQFGFVSSHAANSFAIVTFLMLLIKEKWFGMSIFLWAVLNSLSRVYLGVHFVGDILCGALLGVVVGLLVYGLFRLLAKDNVASARYSSYTSALYTRTGYLVSDISLFLCVLYATYLFIIFYTIVRQGILPY